MTCFWDGLIKELTSKVFSSYFPIKRIIKPRELIQILMEHNTKTVNVMWNKIMLRDQEMIENYTMVKNFNSNNIYNGYLCSACDPFLLLVCELFNVNIEHNYNGNKIIYKNLKNINNRTLYFRSNRNHFSVK